MITELVVENLAIIERARLTFDRGFTVLTGETGAGKSLLVDAVLLALGGRADSDSVRSESAKAVVSMHVTVPNRAAVEQWWVRQFGPAPTGDDKLQELHLYREVSAAGKSTAKVNQQVVTVGQLRELGKLLVDLHGQHDHQALLDPNSHLGFLDAWSGPELESVFTEYSSRFHHFARVQRQLQSVKEGAREWQIRKRNLEEFIQQIDEVAPQPNESSELKVVRERLRHAERLSEAASAALNELSESEVNASDLIAMALRQLRDVTRFDPELEEKLAPLIESNEILKGFVSELRSYTQDVEADPQRLESIEARLDQLERICRLFGDTEVDVLSYREKIGDELAEMNEFSGNEEELVAEAARLDGEVRHWAAELSRLRREMALPFCDQIESALRDLAMERAVFELAFDRTEPTETGTDRVQFFFSANPGEPPRSLAKIASGGELSRVMLAIKTVFAGKVGVDTLVFDEVDAGLSGRAAMSVARKLGELSRHYQVFAISHLPQIAAAADRHFRVEKREIDGRIQVEALRLNHSGRIEDIARMISGDQVTEAAKAGAEELLLSLQASPL